MARERLLSMQQHHAVIGDVRGIGSMLGLEVVKDRRTKEPDKERANRIVTECLSRGLILVTAGEYMNVIRLLYPLVITDAQLAEGMDILDRSIAATN
jgi:4-aminobutyrate aminotransferase / (S)-3-amino-2-methylpropionate transaminase / 5-aminovalerate transaminase